MVGFILECIKWFWIVAGIIVIEYYIILEVLRWLRWI